MAQTAISRQMMGDVLPSPAACAQPWRQLRGLAALQPALGAEGNWRLPQARRAVGPPANLPHAAQAAQPLVRVTALAPRPRSLMVQRRWVAQKWDLAHAPLL